MRQHILTPKLRHRIVTPIHLVVIILAMLLITLITIDTLRNISFLADEFYLHVQFWCCLFFLLDIAVEIAIADNRWKYFRSHILFILVSIPYLNIIHYFQIGVTPEWQYVLRFMPMLRAAYVFAIVTGATTSSRWVNTMLATYMTVLIMVVYFCSLTFFVSEHYVNPMVPDYWSALWWAIMSLTTAGCSVHAVTLTGRVLSVVLSAGGLILFPVFTVFLTNRLSGEKTATPAQTASAQHPDSAIAHTDDKADLTMGAS